MNLPRLGLFAFAAALATVPVAAGQVRVAGEAPIATVFPDDPLVNGGPQGPRVGPDGPEVPPSSPVRLAAEVLSPTEAKLTWRDRAAGETAYRVEVRTVDGEFADVGFVPANSSVAFVQGLTPATGYVFRVRAARQGIFSSYSNEARAATDDAPGPCVADAWTLCLNGGRFRARVRWQIPGGGSGPGWALPVGADHSGLFWFFDPDNLELLVKVLDGCADNGRYWLFSGPATSLQHLLTVTDTRTARVRTYFYPAGSAPLAATDTEAFAGCP